MIAIAIFFTNKNNQENDTLVTLQNDGISTSTASGPRAVSESDYIRGNPNAPIVIIEYSDYDCPFCKQYHATMKQVMDDFGVTGKVAWVYRQFPLTDLHPNSPKISEAAFCVGSIGGNEAFWKFTDTVYDSRDIDEATNVTKLTNFAVAAGVAEKDYLSCMNSNKMEKRVIQDLQDGINAGVQATPHTILIVGNQQAVISGAQPYDVVTGIIQNLVDQLDGKFDPATSGVTEVKTDGRGVPMLE